MHTLSTRRNGSAVCPVDANARSDHFDHRGEQLRVRRLVPDWLLEHELHQIAERERVARGRRLLQQSDGLRERVSPAALAHDAREQELRLRERRALKLVTVGRPGEF